MAKDIVSEEWRGYDELDRVLHRALYKKSFYAFARDFWNEADPQPFVDGWVVQFFCETFQYACRHWIGYSKPKIKVPKISEEYDVLDVRQGKNNYNINIPPRHSKSMIFNVLAGVWIWITNPIKLASVSHTGKLAGQMNAKRQLILNSEKFKFFFPEISLVSNTSSFLQDSRGAELYSVPRDSMTGYGADIIMNDDLTNAEAARKDKEEMTAAIQYYRHTLPSRINDQKKYVIFNIQQRLAPNDITGNIMNDAALSEMYTFIVLPAIFQKKTYIVFPISGEVMMFEKGSPLWEERFGDYEQIKTQVGNSVWQTQYLQNPISSDKAVVKQDMIVCKDQTEIPEFKEMMYASHDFPVKDKETSDFLGSVLGFRTGATLYITDCLEKRMDFVKSVQYVERINDVFEGSIQIIEDKANGAPILQQLQDVVPGMQAYNPGSASKTLRLENASLYLNNGNVVFVRTVWNEVLHKWELSKAMKNLIDRLLSFPYVEHDDIVDAFSMLVLFVFMDRKYMVYGRAFTEANIIPAEGIKTTYTTVFVCREGDIWKMAEIGVLYGAESKLILLREHQMKGSVEDGIKALKQFSPQKKMAVDCSATEAINGFRASGVTIERYEEKDFDQSVAKLNLAFSKKLFLISEDCKASIADVENFKFTKTKDETAKYASTKDGFCSCMRIALRYYGGIV